jgi:hypothetical protein
LPKSAGETGTIPFDPPKRRAVEIHVLVVNSIQTLLCLLRKTAEALALIVPNTMLVAADEVTE